MLKNIGSNWALTIVQIASGFLIMPFAIRTLGDDQYGTWILIASLTGYLSMLNLGIPMSSVHFIAKYSTAKAQDDLDRAVGSCAGLYALMGLAALVIGAVLFVVFQFAYHVTPAFRARADLAFVIVVINVAAGFLAQFPYGIMGAHHDFVAMNKIRLAGEITRFCLTYVFLSLDASLLWLAIVQLSMLSLEYGLSAIAVRRMYPHIRIRFGNFDWAMVRQIFSFSIFVLVLRIGHTLAFQTDALVIGAAMPISTIPFFAVASTFASYQMQFVDGISTVVIPMTTTLHTRGDASQLRAVFLRWSKITAWLTIGLGLFLLVLGPRFIGWWVTPEFEEQSGPILRILMLANFAFLPMKGVSLSILMGLGRPRRPAIGFLLASLANLGLSIILVKPLGLSGVALGTAIPNVIYAVYLAVVTCRALDVRLDEYAIYAFRSTFLGALPILALLCALRYGLDVRGLGQLVASGAVAAAAFAAMSLVVYRGDPHVDIAPWVRRVMVWKRA